MAARTTGECQPVQNNLFVTGSDLKLQILIFSEKFVLRNATSLSIICFC